ncbi:WAS/WASL-interacting protein family member 2-like [Diprion similis]|uniref:WAS/WASL-interacting protein family member 2-like n=1 Tax=Diprion similis TaxID=362088 RepID=UPI001EF9AAC0|nr:WAS/WASL-interacting protein family member 2-like [Diprion similis]
MPATPRCGMYPRRSNPYPLAKKPLIGLSSGLPIRAIPPVPNLYNVDQPTGSPANPRQGRPPARPQVQPPDWLQTVVRGGSLTLDMWFPGTFAGRTSLLDLRLPVVRYSGPLKGTDVTRSPGRSSPSAPPRALPARLNLPGLSVPPASPPGFNTESLEPPHHDKVTATAGFLPAKTPPPPPSPRAKWNRFRITSLRPCGWPVLRGLSPPPSASREPS